MVLALGEASVVYAEQGWPKEVSEFAWLDVGLIATLGDLHRSSGEAASSSLSNRASSVHLEG